MKWWNFTFYIETPSIPLYAYIGTARALVSYTREPISKINTVALSQDTHILGFCLGWKGQWICWREGREGKGGWGREGGEGTEGGWGRGWGGDVVERGRVGERGMVERKGEGRGGEGRGGEGRGGMTVTISDVILRNYVTRCSITIWRYYVTRRSTWRGQPDWHPPSLPPSLPPSRPHK